MEGDLKTLTVFAAASLSEAFTSLGDKFEASHPEAHVVFNYAGSQQLAQQLAQGAPADVFASANQEQMEAVIEQGRISPDSQQILAHNRLVVVAYPQAADGVRRLQDLAEPGTIVVLAGEAVPVGKYAREFIAKAGQEPAFGPAFEQAALKNVVSFEENVRAVFSKVILGEADAGIVYASDAAGVSPQQVRVLEIPDNLNVQASYYIAPTEDSAEPDLAKKFIDFLLTNEGQQVLTDHGFLPARQP
jgi:molybdate transport system substrate-binding protein